MQMPDQTPCQVFPSSLMIGLAFDTRIRAILEQAEVGRRPTARAATLTPAHRPDTSHFTRLWSGSADSRRKFVIFN